MRFLFAAVACLAITAKVSAQLDVSSPDYSLMEGDADSSSDFDISGKMMPPAQQQQQQELPQQRHLPIQEAVKQQIPKQQQQPQQQAVKTAPLQQSMPIKQETMKTNTVLLQPIVLLPKRKQQQTILYAPKRQHKKLFNVDVDRTLSYKVSPSIHAANSRSVDVDFTPIFNARMKNVVLSQQQQQEEEYTPTAQPILLPIQQEAVQSKGGRSSLSSRFTSGISEMPVYEQFQPIQQLQQFQQQQPALSSGLQWNTDALALESRFNPYMSSPSSSSSSSLGSGFSGLGFADLDTNEIQARSGLGAGSDSGDIDYTSLHIGSADTPSVYSLSSLDASLPNVPASSNNLVKLGVSQPLKFKSVLNACVQQPSNVACKQVFKAAKMLVNSPVANDIFRSNIQ